MGVGVGLVPDSLMFSKLISTVLASVKAPFIELPALPFTFTVYPLGATSSTLYCKLLGMPFISKLSPCLSLKAASPFVNVTPPTVQMPLSGKVPTPVSPSPLWYSSSVIVKSNSFVLSAPSPETFLVTLISLVFSVSTLWIWKISLPFQSPAV